MNDTMILYNKSRYTAHPLELHVTEIRFERSITGITSITIKSELQIEYPALLTEIKEFYRPCHILELYDPNLDKSYIFRCRCIRICGRDLTFEGDNYLLPEKEGVYMNTKNIAFPTMAKTVDIDHSFLVPESVKRIIANKLNCDSIKKVIFNPPATVILWHDGTKTVVKKSPGDDFDPYFGFVTAYAKHAFGNNSKIKKLLKEKSNIKIFDTTIIPTIKED